MNMLTIIALMSLMSARLESGVDKFRLYDYIVIFEDYDLQKDSFKKKLILKDGLIVDTSKLIEPILKGRSKHALERGDKVLGYIFVLSKDNPQMKYYVMHDRMAGHVGHKVIRFDDKWVRVSKLIKMFEPLPKKNK